jgi:pyruvate dehydrogenase E2 component (dihydrolipoamide acetyltransferase)
LGPVGASPSLRKRARELGVDLQRVAPTGPNGRVRREDVDDYVQAQLASATNGQTNASPAAPGLLPWPQVDFAKYGPVERKPLSRVQRLSGANLARNWALIPHVTNFDEADITDLEAFRVQVNREQEKAGVRLTMLAFLLKASAAVLAQYPAFNASLDGDELVFKRYFHLGFAADTPQGLMVPVIRDVDKKGLLQIARETAELAALARESKLKPTDMAGGCFSISSLGGIGGTGFTPIINAPEVAILGATRAQTRPLWDGAQFRPRLVLPLMLSWDHRVVDGVAAARFLVALSALLSDFRRTLL